MDCIQSEAARIAKTRQRLMAAGMDETTIDRNIMRLLLFNEWTKEQAQQIINKSKEIKQNGT